MKNNNSDDKLSKQDETDEKISLATTKMRDETVHLSPSSCSSSRGFNGTNGPKSPNLSAGLAPDAQRNDDEVCSIQDLLETLVGVGTERQYDELGVATHPNKSPVMSIATKAPQGFPANDSSHSFVEEHRNEEDTKVHHLPTMAALPDATDSSIPTRLADDLIQSDEPPTTVPGAVAVPGIEAHRSLDDLTVLVGAACTGNSPDSPGEGVSPPEEEPPLLNAELVVDEERGEIVQATLVRENPWKTVVFGIAIRPCGALLVAVVLAVVITAVLVPTLVRTQGPAPMPVFLQIGSTLEGSPRGASMSAIDVSSDGKMIAISSAFGSNENVRFYAFNGTDWESAGKISAIPGDILGFGSEIDLAGDKKSILIAAENPNIYNPNGFYWLYRLNEDQDKWVLNRNFSHAIDQPDILLRRRTIALSENGSFAVYLIGTMLEMEVIDLESGQKRGENILVDRVPKSRPGPAMSSDGKVIAVSGIDYVDVYEFGGRGWKQLGPRIDAPNASSSNPADYDNYFGNSMSLSGDGTVLCVGDALSYGGKGGAFVYEFDGRNWNRLGTGLDLKGLVAEALGYTVSLSYDGTVLALSSGWFGGNFDDSNISQPLRVFKYKRSDNMWIPYSWAEEYTVRHTISALSRDGKTIIIHREGDWSETDVYMIRVYRLE